MTNYQVRRLLGEPYEKARANGMIWYYGDDVGDLEIMFGGQRVELIMVTFWKRSKPVLPKSLLRDYHDFPNLRSCKAITQYLKRHGFQYETEPLLTFDQQTTIQLRPVRGVKVEMIFDREERDHIAKLFIGIAR